MSREDGGPKEIGETGHGRIKHRCCGSQRNMEWERWEMEEAGEVLRQFFNVN
jgi:hypothetical protein